MSGLVGTGVGGVLVGLGNAVSVRTDPLATALADDADELRVAAVRARRRAVLLRTERRTRVRAVLTRA